MQEIVLAVAAKHEIDPSLLVTRRGRRGSRAVAHASWEAMSRLRALRLANGKPPSLVQIAGWLASKDHTNVRHGLARWAEIEAEAA